MKSKEIKSIGRFQAYMIRPKVWIYIPEGFVLSSADYKNNTFYCNRLRDGRINGGKSFPIDSKKDYIKIWW